jgi:DNA-binding transcriptional regulator GbsR (MarR family)
MSEPDPDADAASETRGVTPDAGEAVSAAREEVIEAFARCAELYGMNRSYGHLYGLVYFEDDPLSLDDLVERSGYAKSTVSTAMSTLERFHLVRRRSIPGEGKRAFFEVERDFWYVLQQFVDSEVRREVRIMTRALSDAEAKLADAEGDVAARDLDRVRRLKTLYERGERVLDFVSRLPTGRLAALFRRFAGAEADRSGDESGRIAEEFDLPDPDSENR